MESTYIKLEIRISVLQGKILPEQEDILHALTEQLHDQVIEGSAVIDLVNITEVDGKATNED